MGGLHINKQTIHIISCTPTSNETLTSHFRVNTNRLVVSVTLKHKRFLQMDSNWGFFASFKFFQVRFYTSLPRIKHQGLSGHRPARAEPFKSWGFYSEGSNTGITLWTACKSQGHSPPGKSGSFCLYLLVLEWLSHTLASQHRPEFGHWSQLTA